MDKKSSTLGGLSAAAATISVFAALIIGFVISEILQLIRKNKQKQVKNKN